MYILNIRMMTDQEKGKEEVREHKGKGGYSSVRVGTEGKISY